MTASGSTHCWRSQLSRHKSHLLFILNVGVFLFSNRLYGGDLKVLLLENISAVAVEQFRAAGYEIESHKSWDMRSTTLTARAMPS